MEKQLLFLLDWDMRVTENDLYYHLEPFLAPIRAYQQRQAEKVRLVRLREQEILEYQQREISLAAGPSCARMFGTPVYDSPRSYASYTDDSYTQLRSYASRSSSRLPSRTPSLSPPCRSRSNTLSSDDCLSSGSPASLDDASFIEPREVHIQRYNIEDIPTIIHIEPSTHKLPELSLDRFDQQPAKKQKTSSSNIFSRLLGSAGAYARPPHAAAAC